ncbi:hypothetical protein [Agrobacterium pusense]|uniref:hypothetical protein n=1 Tax=Agrobacterium pusense TaxID=648995 RepID=UPI0010AE3DC3|nr:hypothetical protein [Agrobacterium pusense]WCK26598.1 hypothetical protein CFBP5496_0020575 [Agrobacterium pusense]
MADTVKHTEYPWERVDTADYAEIHPVGKRLQSAIALVGKPDDANLIAAAPELLEALKHLCEFIDREGPAAKEWEAISEWCEKGSAAIAKAEGRS